MIIHSDLSSDLSISCGENPPSLQAYEWPVGDHGVKILSLTPLPLSNLNEGFN